jgi:phosphoribosyl-ATP pyrophosphohydrolase
MAAPDGPPAQPGSRPAETSIERLHAALLALSGEGENFPRTRKLLQSGTTRIAQKLSEEAIEVSLETVKGDRTAVVSESADLIYQLVVLWTVMGIWPAEVWEEMDRREIDLGLAEKLPKAPGPGDTTV